MRNPPSKALPLTPTVQMFETFVREYTRGGQIPRTRQEAWNDAYREMLKVVPDRKGKGNGTN